MNKLLIHVLESMAYRAWIKPLVCTSVLLLIAALCTTIVSAGFFSDWGLVQKAAGGDDPTTGALPLNTTFNDGCPYQSPDDLMLFIASNRPHPQNLGGQNIWVALRDNVDDAWGEPIPLPEPVNSNVDDFCPSPVRGHGLYFVSRRYIEGVSCGTGSDTDIYFTRFNKGQLSDPETWSMPENLGCQINSNGDEWSPSYFEGDEGQQYLYFASTRAGGPGAGNDADIYYSLNFGPAQFVTELNTEFDDHRPNVRKDGREIVFDSTRNGYVGAVRNPDIWTAVRDCSNEDCVWSNIEHLREGINTPQPETRPSLSWDGLRLYFGSARTGAVEGGATLGAADVYTTTRGKLKGNER
jgi:hypothetical protein